MKAFGQPDSECMHADHAHFLELWPSVGSTAELPHAGPSSKKQKRSECLSETLSETILLRPHFLENLAAMQVRARFRMFFQDASETILLRILLREFKGAATTSEGHKPPSKCQLNLLPM